MPACVHPSLQFVGEQKADDGANGYYSCRDCGALLVKTPTEKLYLIQGEQRSSPEETV